MVKLTNVIDTRTGQFHSVAYVKEKNLKWFIDADPEEPEEVSEETEGETEETT